MLNYNMMTWSMRCVAIEVKDIPMYDKFGEVEEFLNKFEEEMPEQQHCDALKWVLHATLARW